MDTVVLISMLFVKKNLKINLQLFFEVLVDNAVGIFYDIHHNYSICFYLYKWDWKE